MSEENHYNAHPVAVTTHYPLQSPQINGSVIRSRAISQLPGQNTSYGYREEGSGYGFNMNGVAGPPQSSHAQPSFGFFNAVPSTSRGPPPNTGPPQWSHLVYAGSPLHDPGQPLHALHPSPEHPGSWCKVPTPFARSHQPPERDFSQPHNVNHSSNYNLHPQHYNRPPHNPVEPSAAPSPPNPYPSSPRTPISSHQNVSTNGIPAPQPFRQPNPSRAPLPPASTAPPMSTLDSAAYRPEPQLTKQFGGSNQPSPPSHSLLPHHQARGSVASSLGPPPPPPPPLAPPPPSTAGVATNNDPHRGSISYSVPHRNSGSYGRNPQTITEDDGKSLERNGSVQQNTRNRSNQPEYDSADDGKQVKREKNSRTPSASMSPKTTRTDPSNDRSPSFPESSTKDSKPNGSDIQGKKKGAPVFRDSDGNEYYENERIPEGVEVPADWQIGTGKLTKGLLLPRMKDGISVNPEWGFTAGGKARQRLPQACRNCRAKKIRCVESDYNELICQHCSKMRIACQRYEKDDDKKKKMRGSQSHDAVKPENGVDCPASIFSDDGIADPKMHAPVKNESKKRKSSDESANGNKRPHRNGSRASSLARDAIMTNAPASSQQQPLQGAPPTEEKSRLALFPIMGGDATARGRDQAESRGRHLRALRENQFGVQDIHGHGRSSSMPDASPLSYTSSPISTVSNVVLHNGGFVEGHSHGYSSAVESRQRAMSSSTPATLMGTPPSASMPRSIGEDPRHPDLPGPVVLTDLMDAYFANVYSQTYAFLHRRTFMENLDSHSPVLLFSMCAVAARFSDHRYAEEVFETRARELIMRNYDNYSLEMVQSLVHMGLHDFGSNNGHKAWMFAGMAVRMGAAMNMNLESRKKEKEREKNAISRECTRRTYWSYYLMDRFNSYGVARPFLTQDHDCHIQLPCNQPSFTTGQYVVTEHLLGANPYHPENGTKYMGAMAYLVRVVGIWGNILKQIHLSGFQIYSPDEGKNKSGHEFNDFVDKLEHWRKTLPTGLEYSNENLAGQIKVGTTGAFVMMHVMWHTAMAYVHRYVRTVGVPKDYIQENIPSSTIVESIRKAFVHADAVLQIMFHVQQKKNLAKNRGEPPITVNAPFLGQAISDACNITVIRAMEVRGEPGGVLEQKRRVAVGLEWLRELKRYWKPIEGMYNKLKKTCRNLEKSTSQPLSAHMVPTPESVDSVLQPGSQYPVDPTNYAADPTSFGASAMNPSIDSGFQFHAFADFLALGNVPLSCFGEAFGAEISQDALYSIAQDEAGFPDLYPQAYSGPHVPVSAFDNTSLVAADMPEPMQIEQTSFDLGDADASEACESDNEDDMGSPNADGEDRKGNIHATYFDLTAVRDGNLQDSSSDTSDHSRRASEVATAKREGNPMDLFNLIDIPSTNLAMGLQNQLKDRDKFTGPEGAAAPANNDMGGQPNLDNSGAQPNPDNDGTQK